MDILTITIRIGNFDLAHLVAIKKAIEAILEKYEDTQIMIAIQSPLPGMQVAFPKK